MGANVGDVELSADDLEAELAVEIGGGGARVAPDKLGAMFPREGDAGEREGATEAGVASVWGDSHAAQLKGGYPRHLGHFGTENGGDAEELAVTEGAEVPGGFCIVAGKAGGVERSARAQHGTAKGQRL